MPRTHAIHYMLAAALAVLALTLGDSAAKDRTDDRDANDAAAAKASGRADSHALSKTGARESVDASSTIRYAARGETLNSQPLHGADTTRRAPLEAALTKQPVNYGSLRNASADTLSVSNRYSQKDDNKASTFTRALADNHAAVIRASEKPTAYNFDRKVITSQRGGVQVSSKVTGDRRAELTDLTKTALRVQAGHRFLDRRPVDTLPRDHESYTWQGNQYRHRGYTWYRPYLYNGYTTYWPVYPPTGYYYSSLPPGCVSVSFGGVRFYFGDDTYYRPADGRDGYVVVDPPQDYDSYPTAPPVAATPDPFAILRAMADYTTSRPRLTLTAANVFDQVTAYGSKIQLADRHTLFIQRPDRLLVQTHSDADDRVTFYDGRSLTLYDARRNIFSRLAAPPTLETALDTLARRYGVSLPLAELVTTPYDSLAAPLLTGQYLGLAMVGPYTCHHLAFTQDSLDWEIWIDASSNPIPRQYSLTYKLLPQAPRFLSTIQTWNDSPIAAGNLQLSLPANAQPVDMVPVPR